MKSNGVKVVLLEVIDKLHSWDVEGNQMERERGVTRTLIKFVLPISKEIKYKVKVVLLEVSLMNFILQISNENKWKVKVVSLEVSLMSFIFRLSKNIK